MGSHSVTCYPTEMRIPPLFPAEAGTRSGRPSDQVGVDKQFGNGASLGEFGVGNPAACAGTNPRRESADCTTVM